MTTADLVPSDAVTVETVTVDVAAAIAAIPDPEVPVISIAELGILRHVEVDEHERTVAVTITPTYSGCPAMDAIEHAVVEIAARAGYAAQVQLRLSPAWTTDWMSESGRTALREFGIAPPERHGASGQGSPSAGVAGVAGVAGAVALTLRVRRVACPQCGSTDTEEVSRFGSTACKALRRCLSCREPFDEFKAL